MVTLYRNKYRVESARRPGWDYSSPGFYFITVCTYKHINLFGNISGCKMFLNEFGKIVYDEWMKSFEIRRELIRDEFVVMPNHFHGIVRLVNGASNRDNDVGGGWERETVGGNAVDVETPGRASLPEPEPQPQPPRKPYLAPGSISSFMAGVKSVISKQINIIRCTPGTRVLQYLFHDHVIRNYGELLRIRRYIRSNPLNWEKDKLRKPIGLSLQETVQEEYEKEDWMNIT
ncbi:MAG: transposase [Fibrobacter sp.]|nr:transposase [Fibrobacter sp.]